VDRINEDLRLLEVKNAEVTTKDREEYTGSMLWQQKMGLKSLQKAEDEEEYT